MLLLRNFILRPNFHRGACVLVHRLLHPLAPGPKSSQGAWSRAANAIIYGHNFARTGITFRSVIGIAYKTPIRNRHSEALVALYSLSNISLDYVNPWRDNHTKSTCHDDRKLCSTRCENSSSG
ncbi:hypothetical protein Taro_040759 [Colocasia esculenta]|uniref:Uncharacterized protein n=1 Tax=Colocasia esculenta TaxID=4460 RepID=A0A843W9S7_COLES|nr:hypothetical protein [Colocasia esculenta]